MTVFVLTLVVFAAVVLMMAIGVMVSGKRIQGSCGGLNAAMTNEKGEKVCGYCGITIDVQKPVCGKPDQPINP